jgi:hypothetical protein
MQKHYEITFGQKYKNLYKLKKTDGNFWANKRGDVEGKMMCGGLEYAT